MKLRHALTALAAAPLALAFVPRADQVSFKPAAGATASKDYSLEFAMDVGDVTMEVDGMDMSANIPADVSLMLRLAATITDEFLESRDGRATDLIRSFDAMSLAYESPDDSGEETVDDLEGKKVRFKWNAEESRYDVSFHETEGNEDVLEGLGADMDLTALLPSREVSEGDTWTVSAKELGTALLFGADPSRIDRGEENAEAMALVEEYLLPQIEKLSEAFSARCTYKGRRDEGGTNVAVIEVAVDGEGTLDLADAITAMAEQQAPPEIELSIDVAVAKLEAGFKGTGTLLWNVGAGHIHSFDLPGDLELAFEVDVSVDAQGEQHEAQISADLSGKAAWKVEPSK